MSYTVEYHDIASGRTGAAVVKGQRGGVESVNGRTGAVTLSAADVGAVAMSALLDWVYPVGSYYWSSEAISPATLFGGTWEPVRDVFLLAAGDAFPAGSTGGEASHALTEAEMPAVSGSFDIRRWTSGGMVSNSEGIVSHSVSDSTGNSAASSGTSYSMQKVTVSFGNGQAHNNMPPYLAACCWHRTA